MTTAAATAAATEAAAATAAAAAATAAAATAAATTTTAVPSTETAAQLWLTLRPKNQELCQIVFYAQCLENPLWNCITMS